MAEIRVFAGSENLEVNKQVLTDEFIILTAVCGAFYVAYTTAPKQQVYVFNGRTSMMVKNGLVIEGGCFLDANEDCMCFAVLTLKGSL
jgi:hypothetical protein